MSRAYRIHHWWPQMDGEGQNTDNQILMTAGQHDICLSYCCLPTWLYILLHPSRSSEAFMIIRIVLMHSNCHFRLREPPVLWYSLRIDSVKEVTLVFASCTCHLRLLHLKGVYLYMIFLYLNSWKLLEQHHIQIRLECW